MTGAEGVTAGIPRQRAGVPDTGHPAGGAARQVPVDRDWMSATLSALVRRHQVPGAQLAVHTGGGTIAVEVGEPEHGAGTPVTRETAFPIGSVSKSFTATVAMILVADGDVDLDAPLGEHVAELDEPTGQLTLRQVLSHTGGLASGPGSAEVANVSLRHYVSEHCRRQRLVLPPGTGFSYSNMGYLIVGRLIETITGMSWREAMESILLRPLGIDPAFIGTSTGRAVATGHSVNTAVGRTRPVRQSQAPVEAPAGALAVSAVDLARLAQLHVGQGRPELLTASDAARMRQAVPTANPFGLADGWGLGLAVFRAGATDWVGHDGNADGTSCHLRISPADGWVIALTSNANTGTSMWEDLLAELQRVGVPIPSGPTKASPGPLATPTAPPPGCVGMYANGSQEYLVATDGDGRLGLYVDNDLRAWMTFYDDSHFTLRDPSSDEGTQAGCLLRNPVTGAPEHLQIGGRLIGRQLRASDCFAS